MLEVDGNNDADDPWDFGTNTQYPRLKYGGLDPATPGGYGHQYGDYQQRRRGQRL